MKLLLSANNIINNVSYDAKTIWFYEVHGLSPCMMANIKVAHFILLEKQSLWDWRLLTFIIQYVKSMANNCYTTYKITGTQEAVKNLWDTLSLWM